MEPVDVKSSTYIDSSKRTHDEYPKFKIGHIVRISKYKNIFAKGYVPNWSEELFITKSLKIHPLWRGRMSLVILIKTKKLWENFTKMKCKKQIKKSLELRN